MGGPPTLCPAAALALALAACGQPAPHIPRTTHEAAEAAAAPAVPGFAAQAPHVAPGERMSYAITMHGLDVATFTVVVGDVVAVDGVDAVVVQTGVQTSPLVSLVHRVSDNFTSWIDVATSRPRVFRSEELADPDADDIETTDTDVSAVVDGKIALAIEGAAEGKIVEQQVVGAAPLFDLNSFLVVLRGWSPPVGTVETADVVRSRYLWRTVVTFVGYEHVHTALGTLPALRFDGESRRLLRDGTPDPKIAARRYSLWVSDDADRVPLSLVARTDYGDLEMAIGDYQPGGAWLAETRP